MTIKIRIILLLSVLALCASLFFWHFQWTQNVEEANEQQAQSQAQVTRLQQLATGSFRSVYRVLRNYSSRAEMVDSVVKRDPSWVENYVRGKLSIYRVDALWVVSGQGALISGYDHIADKPLAGLPLPAEELRGLLQQNRFFSFAVFLEGDLYQVQGLPIRAKAKLNSSDSAPGWLLAARRWDEAVLDDLADAAQAKVTLTSAAPAHEGDLAASGREVWLPVLDHRGQPLAGLSIQTKSAPSEDSADESLETTYFILSNAGLILVVGLMLQFWILRPFRRIHASLAGGDPSKLAPLLEQKDEFGDMARVLQASLRNSEQLQRSIDSRAQLGRDLHDGVVQGIFAAGMTLSRVQSLVAKDPPAAQQLLNETRDALNRIILELRGHIEEIKPNLQDIPFGEAVEQVIKQLQGPTPARVMLDLDDDLIARQSAHFLNQTLQFVREAVSNAMRHGQPSQLAVSWQRTPDGSRLTVFDNGVGFDLQTPKPGGYGLNNLSERALALGGRLEINTVPGWGTQIGLILPTTAP